MCAGISDSEVNNIYGEDFFDLEPFHLILSKHDLKLERGKTTTLQVNMGLLCNQACRHCHLNAGPDSEEVMDLETSQMVLEYAKRGHFDVIDITGGAPELNPHLLYIVKEISSIAPRIMVRSNLTALNEGTRDYLMDLFKEHQVVVVASFPSINESQTDSQRGRSVFKKSVSTLKRLNALGYGQESTGLELNLISNPTGAFLPPSQAQTEKRFRKILMDKWGISFTNLYNFANVPLGRFRTWLERTGNFEPYMKKLVSNFNPCAVDGLMCRSLVSVSWDGYLYDCDFNLARGIPLGGQKTHITDMPGPPEPGSLIAVADHCHTCTAGAGFT